MKRSVLSFTAMLLLAGPGCASASGRTPSTDYEPAVRAAMANFMDALNALDVERMDAAFTDDVTAFVPTAQAEEVAACPGGCGIPDPRHGAACCPSPHVRVSS